MLKILLCLFSTYSPPQDTLPLIDSNQVLEVVSGLYDREEYDSAVALLKEVSPYDSNYLLAQEQLLTVFTANDQLAEAIDLGVTLIDSRSDLAADFYIASGNALLQNDQVEKGLAVYRRGLEFFPYNHFLLYNAGYAHYRMGQYLEAVDHFQRVALIKPFYSRSHQMLGNIMSRTKFRTKAALSYLTYLALEPDQNWALVRLNSLMNESLREEGSLTLEIDNGCFDHYDNLLRSKAAFDDRYKSGVDFEAPAAQQSELLINKLKYVAATDDFWMDFYVPYLEKIARNDLTTDFVYFMLYSSGNEGVTDWIDKHEKEQDAWIDITNDLLTDNKLVNKRTLLDSTRQFSHWFFSGGEVQAIGLENADGENIGPYEFYHENGRLQARGWYNEVGQVIGWWEYYSDKGILQSRRHYNDNGELSGQALYYDEKGNLRSEGTYRDGKIQGAYNWYHACGPISEAYPYEDGEERGEGKIFFKTGEVKTVYQLSDGDLVGEYVNYFKTGAVEERTTYEGDQKEGPYSRYYADGTLREKGQYAADLATGDWEFYYPNGEVRSRGEFAEDHSAGEWQYFYSNKQPMRTELYDEEGELHGLTVWYDRDGVKHSERNFDGGMLVGYKFFDKAGNVLSEASDPNGNMPYISYYASGEKLTETNLIAGLMSGAGVSYHRNGKVYQEGTMKNDYWHGVLKQYTDQGFLELSATYDEGDMDGYYRRFHPNGQVSREGWAINNNIEQQWREYYVDGSLKESGYYFDAVLQGPYSYYSPEGYLMRTDVYEDGVVVIVQVFDSLGEKYSEVDLPKGSGKLELPYTSGKSRYSVSRQCGDDVTDATFYYRTGEKQSVYEVENGESKRFVSYARNGAVLIEGQYLNGNRFGEWKYYFEGGGLEAEYAYDVEGQLQGDVKFYYENGQLESVCEYRDGKKDGKCQFYDTTGQLQIQKHYEYNRGVVSYQYEAAPGQLSEPVLIPRQGELKVEGFFANGKPSTIQRYKDGVYHGEIVHYYAEGPVHEQYQYNQGMLERATVYYKDGTLQSSTEYLYDQKHGQEKKYYPSGVLKEEIEWFDDEKNGWHRRYRADGSLVSEEYYWNGKGY